MSEFGLSFNLAVFLEDVPITLQCIPWIEAVFARRSAGNCNGACRISEQLVDVNATLRKGVR